MNWYQITWSEDEAFGVGAKIEVLKEDFGKLLERYAQIHHTLPTKVALFVTKAVNEPATVYFSPKCGDYFPELLQYCGAKICNQPSPDLVTFLHGEGSPKDYF
jgi:hypothetical protein